jgi:hypothetical protein
MTLILQIFLHSRNQQQNGATKQQLYKLPVYTLKRRSQQQGNPGQKQ